MTCPYCKSINTKVVDKRDNNETNTTRRRRECLDCQKRFTTYERVENVLLNVQKRDGKIEEYSREKMKLGIMKAVKKRNIPEEKINEIIEEIEQCLLSKDAQTVTSVEIGELVLKKLMRLDKLGALLFAAVYKEFQTLEDVEKELQRLSKKYDNEKGGCK